MSLYKKIIVCVLLINFILVATHKGEFWPFSIFPMFSEAGKPWSRGVVENVQDTTRANLWNTKPLSEIDDRVLPLEKYGVHPIDFANYINKTKDWNTKKIKGLRSTFEIKQHPNKMWMITRVVGSINQQDSVVIKTIPIFLMTADTTYQNHNLFSD